MARLQIDEILVSIHTNLSLKKFSISGLLVIIFLFLFGYATTLPSNVEADENMLKDKNEPVSFVFFGGQKDFVDALIQFNSNLVNLEPLPEDLPSAEADIWIFVIKDEDDLSIVPDWAHTSLFEPLTVNGFNEYHYAEFTTPDDHNKAVAFITESKFSSKTESEFICKAANYLIGSLTRTSGSKEWKKLHRSCERKG